MPTLNLSDPGTMEHVVEINAFAFFFGRCVEQQTRIGTATRLVEDLGLDDFQIMDFVEMLEKHLSLRIAKPFMGNTLGELSEDFRDAFELARMRKVVTL